MIARKKGSNAAAVSSVMSYLLTFVILTMVMSSVIYTTDVLIDDKAHDAARIQAQRLVNLIADTLIDFDTAIQTHSDMEFSKQIPLPDQLAGKQYYIDISDAAIYVNLTDGEVHTKSITYDFSDININMNRRIFGGGSLLKVSYVPPSEQWKVDFGFGNSYEHSPVRGGYINAYAMPPATPTLPSYINIETFYPDWAEDDYQYRIPILLNFTPPPRWKTEPAINRAQHFINVPIVLTPENFNYDAAHVMFYDENDNPIHNVYSGKTFRSDMKIWWEGGTKDPGGGFSPALPSAFIQVPTLYSIEYWNPNGSSLIYMRVPLVLPASSIDYGTTLITLYYGHKDVASWQDLAIKCPKRSIGDIALGTGPLVLSDYKPLFEDFDDNDLTDMTDPGNELVWDTTHVTLPKGDDPSSCVTLEDGEYIVTDSSPFYESFEIDNVFIGGLTPPELQQVYNYIIDARMKIIQGNGSLIVRSKLTDIGEESCVFSLNHNYSCDTPGLWLHYHNDTPPPAYTDEMDNAGAPNAKDWVRIRTYQFNRTIAGSPAEEWFYFNCFVYENDTFAPFPNNVSNISKDKFTLNESRFGLGAGLIPNSEDATVIVDWIRVIKTTGLYQPNVSVGSIEYKNFKWSGSPPAVEGESRKEGRADPFDPDPMTRDFVYDDQLATFELGLLPAGSYRLIVFKGDLEEEADLYELTINYGSESIKTPIPATAAGSIVNISILFTLDSAQEVSLDFPAIDWLINGLYVEKDYYGIRVQ